jgi:hypothetical protein
MSDIREDTIRNLIAIEEHDKNLDPFDRNDLDRVIEILNRSINRDCRIEISPNPPGKKLCITV